MPCSHLTGWSVLNVAYHWFTDISLFDPVLCGVSAVPFRYLDVNQGMDRSRCRFMFVPLFSIALGLNGLRLTGFIVAVAEFSVPPGVVRAVRGVRVGYYLASLLRVLRDLKHHTGEYARHSDLQAPSWHCFQVTYNATSCNHIRRKAQRLLGEIFCRPMSVIRRVFFRCVMISTARPEKGGFKSAYRHLGCRPILARRERLLQKFVPALLNKATRHRRRVGSNHHELQEYEEQSRRYLVFKGMLVGRRPAPSASQ